MDNVTLTLSGRDFKDCDLNLLKEIVELYPKLTRIELIETICENMDLFSSRSRGNKQLCIKLLEKLEEDGVITLKQRKSRRVKKVKKHLESSTMNKDDMELIAVVLGETDHPQSRVVSDSKRGI